MPATGFIATVSGMRMATPFAPPKPGRTPTITPRTSPIIAARKFAGCAATLIPIIRLCMFSATLVSLQPQNGKTTGSLDVRKNRIPNDPGR
jgi:hypothetical protein